jgi:chromosome segregation ATPase
MNIEDLYMSNDNNQITRLEDLNNRLEKAKEQKMRIEALLEQVERRNREQIDIAKNDYLNNPSLTDEEVLQALRQELSRISKENEEKLSQYEDEISNIESRIAEINKNLNI